MHSASVCFRIFLTSIALACFSIAASADIVSLSFSGSIQRIDRTDPAVSALIAVGQPVSGTVRYDSSTAIPAVVSPPCGTNDGCYWLDGSMALSWGGISIPDGSADVMVLLHNNLASFGGADTLLIGTDSYYPLLSGYDTVISMIDLQLINLAGTALTGTAVPVTLDASSFSQRWVEFRIEAYGGGTGSRIFDGVATVDTLTVTTIPQTVPEPASLTLLLTGGSLAACKLRRKLRCR